MAGGYPCCCLERFDSSVSGAESGGPLPSGLPPGSFWPTWGSLFFVDCATICDRRAPAWLRVDVELARVPVSIGGDTTMCPDTCDELFNGTYFLESVAPLRCTCRWYYQFGYEPQYIGLCLNQVSLDFDKPGVRVDIDVSNICSMGFDVTARFIKDFDGECITLEQLHGLVVPVHPGGTSCQPPQGKATVYVI